MHPRARPAIAAVALTLVVTGCAAAGAGDAVVPAGACPATQLRLADGQSALVQQGETVALVADYLMDACNDVITDGEPVPTDAVVERDVTLTPEGGEPRVVGTVSTNDGSSIPILLQLPADLDAGAAMVGIEGEGPSMLELQISPATAAGGAMIVDYVYYRDLPEMVEQATYIASGTIVERAAIDAREGFERTDYRFVVDEVLQGEVAAGDELLVQVPGTPDMDVSPPHGLEVGRDFVLFLVSITADPAGIVGGPAGAFLIDGESLLPRSTGPGTVQLTWEDLRALQQP